MEALSIREGVCYIGMAFKVDEKSTNPRTACCAAQMFLDSGDGVVFRGAVGPWYNPRRGEFHLSQNAARELMSMAVKAYEERVGKAPSELFLHGKVQFNNEEMGRLRGRCRWLHQTCGCSHPGKPRPQAVPYR